MPCPNCNAPDIQNAQANYCFYCGYTLNPARQKKETENSKSNMLFVLFAGLQLFMIIFYIVVPRFSHWLGFDLYDGYTYRYISVFWALAETTLLLIAGISYKQTGMRTWFIVFACVRFVLMILSFFFW